MLDYQMIMVAREVSQERVQGRPTAPSSAPFAHLQRRYRAAKVFLAALAERSARMGFALRYQNRHRSVEGRT
ncbi:MAG: hypothetical protein DYG89_09290 [Caldilinea sp. CFX5]|nr:hypothetical protein [Caldilinea sp. CFX5]